VTDYRNDTPQADRLETLLNDKRVQKDASTFLSHTHSEDSGRFAKPQTVIGLDSVQYPTLPENSWTNDPTPTEPPLGIDVNAMEPVGEEFEVAASLECLERAAQEASPQSLDAKPARGAADRYLDREAELWAKNPNNRNLAQGIWGQGNKRLSNAEHGAVSPLDGRAVEKGRQ